MIRGMLCWMVLGALPAVASAQADMSAKVDFFERKIRPILVDNCYNCHSANTNSKGGLRVDDRGGLTVGGNSGPAVVPGHPEKSLLLKAVRHVGASVKMPPKKKITDEEIADLAVWIKDGAAWPQDQLPKSVGKSAAHYAKLKKEHWAWQPLQNPQAPAVKNPNWAKSDVDRFLLAKLEEKGLKPAPDADRPQLLRRITFDLTGLPPTVAELDNFLKDTSPKAFENVVDRLLASPAFGERWGRHWLDVARYGESTGSARNLPLPHAWRYRDYVLDAFQNDMPYDQFLREQIAGDLLPAKSEKERERQLVATGFLALGVKDVNQRFKVRFIMDNIDEQIDVMTRAILGLTASCARCHDHKFDPIPTADYYALAGIFQSSDLCAGLRNKMGGGGMDYYDPALLITLGGSVKSASKEQLDKAKAALAQARSELTILTDDPTKNAGGQGGEKKLKAARQKVTQLQAALLSLSDPASLGPVAYGLRDSKTVADTEIRIRGEAEKLGPVVPRGFLTLVDVEGAPKVNPEQSGRLELAHWLASPKNPLTSRVMANRVWKYLYGNGLVSSVDNFGVTGDVPSHPELLDHLSNQFVAGGWSVKKLIRSLVLTRSYQLSSDSLTENAAIDPGNRLVWRHSPRRLEAEEIRDAMLATSGKLDRTRPAASPAANLRVTEMQNNGAEAQNLVANANLSLKRSIYLPLVRTVVPRSLEVFDFADQGLVVGSRDTTTVAPQALYMLNDPFVAEQAKAFALNLLKSDLDAEGRIQRAFREALGRDAHAKEIERTKTFLVQYATDFANESEASSDPQTAAWISFTQALLASAEFRYVP